MYQFEDFFIKMQELIQLLCRKQSIIRHNYLTCCNTRLSNLILNHFSIFKLSSFSSLKYKNRGKAKAIATKKLKGMKTHQYFIFNFRASGIYHAKNVKTTTIKSALKDWAGKVVLVCAI